MVTGVRRLIGVTDIVPGITRAFTVATTAGTTVGTDTAKRLIDLNRLQPSQRRDRRPAYAGRRSSSYEKRAFKRCLYSHARLVAPLIRVIRPRFFARDLGFVVDLGAATDVAAARSAASHFHDKSDYGRGFLSHGLRIRVSGRKAIRLAHRLFAEQGQRDPAEQFAPLAGNDTFVQGRVIKMQEPT